MEKLKEALFQFADSNPSLFRHDGFNSSASLIEQRFSQFFFDFQTPNHPPYAAMIHKAIGELNEKRGSSEESISKYIKQEFAELPWAHSTLLKHHLKKLCDRKEISITHKQRYLLPVADSEKHLKRKQVSETGKKNSRHNKKRKKSKKKETNFLDSQETKKQIVEVFQEQDQVLPLLDDEKQNVTHNELHEPEWLNIEYQKYEEGNNLTDVCVQEKMEEGGVCADDKEQIEIRKKKRKLKMKSKRRGKMGKRNEIDEKAQLQDSSEANLKQKNKDIDCGLHDENQGTRVWTKSRIKKMSEEKNGQRAKLRSFKKKKGVSNDKDQKKHKTRGRHNKTLRRSSRKR